MTENHIRTNKLLRYVREKKSILLAFSAAVIFITTYILILPAFTLDEEEAVEQGGIDLPASVEEVGTEETASTESAGGRLDVTGDGFTVTAAFGEETGIPSDAVLQVKELTESDEAYDEHVARSEKALNWEKGSAAQVHLFDICIADPEDSSRTYQPAEGTSVDVQIELDDQPQEEWSIVHFGRKPEVVESETENSTVTFEASGFSMYAILSTGETSNLDGKKFAIINTNLATHESVQNGTQNNGTRLTAATFEEKQIDGSPYIIADDITLWHFSSAGGNSYYIQDENGKYININGYANVSLSDSPQAITAVPNENGQVRLEAGGYALNAWNDNVSGGITGGNWDNYGEHFTLYGLDEIIRNRADKVSVTELANQYTSQNPIENVIIYTRIENSARDGFDYYAVSEDGSLKKIHDIGDTVGWTSAETGGQSLNWKMTVHERDGQPNGYFDFQSMGGDGKYLIPSPQGILKTDDPNDPRDLGVNLKGWENGEYGSTIERWDGDAHAYTGYALDPSTMKLVPYTGADPDQQELEFLFARIPSETPQPGQLHTVDTLDGKSKGITIKMYDFDGYRLYQSSPPRSWEMTNVLGPNSVSSTNDNGVGYANRGLVSNSLGGNGFPTATQTGRSLADLFNDAHLKAEANNLFVKQVYDETGYYSYDSSMNYAYLDQDNKQFILYREVAAPEMEKKGTPSAEKGNFFPFDSLQQLADQGSVFTDRTVKYDGDLQRIPVDHPQYDDTLYKVPDDGASDGYASYFFGMTMEADFYQGPDGKDEKGQDTIFEFNGDDDMWLYIDGQLALDIGGCHGAVRGTINFATGDVKVYGTRPYSTTIRDLFQSGNVLPDGSAWTEAGAAKWFKGNTFADYTQHSFKMMYLERGSYASNLKVNFNLLTIEPGSLVLEKKLPENVQSAYGNSTFAYQIFTVVNGKEVLYEPPAAAGSAEARYVTYEDSGERVLPQGQTESAGFKPEYVLDGRTYRNVYFLKPGQAIVLPVQDKSVQYYVREIGIDTSVYDRVTVNGEDVPITTRDSVVGQTEDLTPTNLAACSLSTVQNRGRVTYRNYPKEDHVHNLRLEKVIDSPVRDPNALFRFDVQLQSTETGQLTPYNNGEYYIVKTKADGTDQYYRYENNELVPSDEPVAYKAGISGSIANIQEGYTILIKGLMAGTDFQVTESQKAGEMPAGYTYIRTDVANADDPEPGVADSQGSIRTGSSQARADAKVTITNRPDGRLIVEKIWDSGDFVTVHGDVYVALYKKNGSGDTQSLEMVPDSVRKLELDPGSGKYRTEYYLPSADLSSYVVREVKVTIENGKVKTVDSYVEEGGYITVRGETTTASGGQATAANSYTVHYVQGEQNGTSRTDTVKNTLPKVSLYKVNEATGAAKQYLSGAEFALETEDGNPVADSGGSPVTFRSDNSGRIFVDRYFSVGTYYLRETAAPAGYCMLEHRIKLIVSENSISCRMEEPGITLYQDQDTDKSIYRFEIMNNPGVELPSAGGRGTTWIYLLGSILVIVSGILLAARRRLRLHLL